MSVQQYLHIDLESDYTLDFKIHNTPLASLWLARMALKDQYPIDHPDRFYGFDSQEQEVARAEKMVTECIETINAYQFIIEKPFNGVSDQDGLNYLHSIFERYHGLLNQQKTMWWFRAPTAVKKALAELNIAVHRCESAARRVRPRFVCTWFGLPKDNTLTEDIMKQYGMINPPFGSVCLNYVEIGKTLFELSVDNDQHISDDAFQPFSHYNPDFVVRFFELTTNEVDKVLQNMQQYYQAHRDFFIERSLLDFNHVKLLPLQFPVAKLIETVPREQLFKDIQQRQHVTRVYIDETMHHSNSRRSEHQA
jgi:hypothetical protein